MPAKPPPWIRKRNEAFKRNYVLKDDMLVYVGKRKKKSNWKPRKPAVIVPPECDKDETITLNWKMVEYGRTKRGSYRPKSIKMLGVSMTHGWPDKLRGRRVKYRDWCMFVHCNTGYWPTPDDLYNLTSTPSASPAQPKPPYMPG